MVKIGRGLEDHLILALIPLIHLVLPCCIPQEHFLTCFFECGADEKVYLEALAKKMIMSACAVIVWVDATVSMNLVR